MERSLIYRSVSWLLVSVLSGTIPSARGFDVSDLEEFTAELGDQEVLDAIDSAELGELREVSGEQFVALIQNVASEEEIDEGDEESVCQPEFKSFQLSKKQKRRLRQGEKRRRKRRLVRTTHTEVLFVADLGNPVDGEIRRLNSAYFSMDPLYAQAVLLGSKAAVGTEGALASVPKLEGKALKEWVQNAMIEASQLATFGELGEDEATQLYIEAMVMAARKEKGLSEYQLRDKLVDAINEVSSSDEERFFLLSRFASRMYRNYNYTRSPGDNNPNNNPYGREVPKGDITLNEGLAAAYKMDRFSGLVCNDISEDFAMIGEKLFPDKDVLVVNGGTHFGVIVTDGKETRVIDGSSQFIHRNHLSLIPENLTPNARISKVKNGQLQEIAVVDTQVGQVLNKAYGLDQPVVLTDRKVSDILASAKKVWERSDRKHKELGATGGVAKLDDSQMVVGVVKYESENKYTNFYFGGGAAFQQFKSGNQSAIVHFKTGINRAILRYKHPHVQVKYDVGAFAGVSGGSYSMKHRQDKGGFSVFSVSGQLNLRNRVQFQTKSKSPDGVSVGGEAQVIHSLGPKSWGETTGAASDIKNVDFGRLWRNVGFHLNSVNLDVNARKPLARNTASVTTASYQGTAIGQKIDLTTGIDVKLPSGMKVYYFVGYANTDLKGYQTQNSLLVGPTGGKAGVRVENRRGMTLEGQVEGLGTAPQGGATLKVPLKTKTRGRGRSSR